MSDNISENVQQDNYYQLVGKFKIAFKDFYNSVTDQSPERERILKSSIEQILTECRKNKLVNINQNINQSGKDAAAYQEVILKITDSLDDKLAYLFSDHGGKFVLKLKNIIKDYIDKESVDVINEADKNNVSFLKRVTVTILHDLLKLKIVTILRDLLKEIIECEDRKIIKIADGFNGDIDKGTKEFSKIAKFRYSVFISAITGKGDKKTLEYNVAKKLKERLEKMGIGVFWWEQKPSGLPTDEMVNALWNWSASVNIMMGLAFSTLYIGLSFDTLGECDEEGNYDYDCLKDSEDGTKPNYFRYELETFRKLYYSNNNADIPNLINYKDVLNGVVDKNDIPNVVPINRKAVLFAYGSPKDFNDHRKLLDDMHSPGFAACKVETITNKTKDNNTADNTKKGSNFAGETTNKTNDANSAAEKETNSTNNETSNKNETNNKCDQKVVNRIVKQILKKLKENDKEGVPYLSAVPKLSEEHFSNLNELDVAKEFFGWTDDKPADGPYAVYPQNYFFEYAVIDKSGKNVRDRFTFFLEKQEGNAENKYDLCLVINDWNNAFIADHNLRKAAVEGDAFKKGEAPEQPPQEILSKYPLVGYYKCEVKLYGENKADDVKPVCEFDWHNGYTDNKCKATIIKNVTDNARSISGYIGFTSANDKYEKFGFAINLFEKQVIYYEVNTGKNSVIVSFTCSNPEVYNIGLRLKLCSGDNSADNIAYVPITQNMNNGREALLTGDKLVFTDVENADKHKHRLFFVDEKFNRFYRLCDTTNGENDSGRFCEDGKPLRCIYCGTEIESVDKKLLKRGKFFCGWKPVGNSENADDKSVGNSENTADDADKLKSLKGVVRCRGLHIEPTNKVMPNDGDYLLPKNYPHSKTAIVSLIANAETGKSVFISKLFNIQFKQRKELTHDDYNYQDLTVTSTKPISGGYFSSEIRYPEYYDDRVNGRRNNVEGIYGKELMNYGVIYYSDFVKRTEDDPKNASKLMNMPLIIKCGDKTNNYISFFDVPGAYVCDENNTEHQIRNSDCVILCVNIKNDKGEDNIDDVKKLLEKVIEKTAPYKDFKRDEESEPKFAIAVVLCKFDMHEKEFDVNCAVRSSSPDIASGELYKGSDYEHYINTCSEEVASFIKSREEQVGFVEEIKKFRYYKFFAVSSIGRSDSIKIEKDGSNNNKTTTRFVTTQRGIEHVLNWIAYQMGIVDA